MTTIDNRLEKLESELKSRPGDNELVTLTICVYDDEHGNPIVSTRTMTRVEYEKLKVDSRKDRNSISIFVEDGEQENGA